MYLYATHINLHDKRPISKFNSDIHFITCLLLLDQYHYIDLKVH